MTKTVKVGGKNVTLYSMNGMTWLSRPEDLPSTMERLEKSRITLNDPKGEGGSSSSPLQKPTRENFRPRGVRGAPPTRTEEDSEAVDDDVITAGADVEAYDDDIEDLLPGKVEDDDDDIVDIAPVSDDDEVVVASKKVVPIAAAPAPKKSTRQVAKPKAAAPAKTAAPVVKAKPAPKPGAKPKAAAKKKAPKAVPANAAKKSAPAKKAAPKKKR
jgi:hypothetical protein